MPKTFKLMVTGRDDRVPEPLRASCKQIVLPTGVDVSDNANKDIRRFFERRFAELPGSLFPEWPGERILDDLTRRAAGLFIWAETIMRLLKKGIPNKDWNKSFVATLVTEITLHNYTATSSLYHFKMLTATY
jgi:hypothetical protein